MASPARSQLRGPWRLSIADIGMRVAVGLALLAAIFFASRLATICPLAGSEQCGSGSRPVIGTVLLVVVAALLVATVALSGLEDTPLARNLRRATFGGMLMIGVTGFVWLVLVDGFSLPPIFEF